MKNVIRLGDKTDHGGEVISASTTMMVYGKGVARVGDMVSCPILGHGINAIVEGDARLQDQGLAVALNGHRAACGCRLISTVANVGIKTA